MTQAWRPECAEDELLLAFTTVKRSLFTRAGGADPGAFPILHRLAAYGPTRQVALAEQLGLDASTVSRHMRELVKHGLAAATRDPHDRRATVLTITPEGREVMTERLRMHRDRLRDATSTFTDQERAELVRLLHKLAATLDGREESA